MSGPSNGNVPPGSGSTGSTSTESPLMTEVPSSLKQLARLVVRGFYGMEDALIIDMLVRFPCLREEDLAELLKFDKKMLRAKISLLRVDKFVQTKQRIETDEEGKVVKMNCYFINYKVFVNIVKYKLDHMHKKMETSERDATNRSSFICKRCTKTFTDLEADRLFDPQTFGMRCTYCSGEVEEDESAGPKSDSRLLLAKFNEQMEKLYDILKAVETIRLAPVVLEPEPAEINQKGKTKNNTSNAPADGEGKWSGEASRGGGFRTEDQHVNITFGDNAQDNREAAKEVPIWITESTVNRDEDTRTSLLGNVLDDDSNSNLPGVSSNPGVSEDQSDEITSLLLRHEKRNAQPAFVPPGSDSDKSDESDFEDVSKLEQAANPNNEEVEMMSDEDDGELPTVRIGNDEVTVTDVTEELIAKMTAEEKERYTQVFQDFYSHMYE
ncbi:hypothetical protein TCAL_10048 [Tigriopus californicus]|uniref:General transcription factor IIE subunit 1 n=1 Tax=Tigriopus californicus TaxID=6832 RepID=A0A553PQF7_TIGCA|nr:general transcription factor IIE subunit 1-like [Tigriopus californicus]TRY79901.1 hypothetical protein TCAL_10048 [Tigriopus californicus]